MQNEVLDIGPGDTPDRSATVGVDIFPSLQNRKHKIPVVSQDVLEEGLPFEDSSLNGIVSNFTSRREERDSLVTEILPEIERVLRPGGWLRFTTFKNRQKEVISLLRSRDWKNIKSKKILGRRNLFVSIKANKS